MQCKKDSTIAGFEDGREKFHELRNVSSRKSEKGKKMDFPVKPSDSSATLMTPSILSSETLFRLLLRTEK